METLLEKLRRTLPAAERRLAREDLLLAGLETLLAQAERGARTTGAQKSTRVDSGPRYQILVRKCPSCGGGSVASARGDLPLAPAALAAIECDARILAGAGRAKATIPPAMRRAVLARDGHACRAPGCGATRFLEIHHVLPRSRGGATRPENLITLCGDCHRLLHEGPPVGGALMAMLAGIASGAGCAG